MLHPDLVLKKSPVSGKCLFAKKRIPKGTILWRFKDKDVKVYTKNQYNKFSKRYKAILRKYAYEDEEGNLIYCTDNAKYWNHSCEPNVSGIMGMGVAIKTIEAGEEITYDYALMLPKFIKPFKCNCGSKSCRGVIKREPENSIIVLKLDALVKEAIKDLFKVKQPLLRVNERNYLRSFLKRRKIRWAKNNYLKALLLLLSTAG